VGFSLGVAGWTVIGGFGLSGPSLVESLLYLVPWDEHMCVFALIETINKRDSKKKKTLLYKLLCKYELNSGT